jgi:hypothetical protein
MRRLHPHPRILPLAVEHDIVRARLETRGCRQWRQWNAYSSCRRAGLVSASSCHMLSQQSRPSLRRHRLSHRESGRSSTSLLAATTSNPEVVSAWTCASIGSTRFGATAHASPHPPSQTRHPRPAISQRPRSDDAARHHWPAWECRPPPLAPTAAR